MNKMKKFASLLLALVMAFALAAPAYADDTTTGSITIGNAVAGQSYSIYKILDLESYNATSGAYAYKVASEWDAFSKTTDFTEYFAIDEAGYVTWKDTTTEEMTEEQKAAHNDARAAAFAKLALAYAKADATKIAPTATDTAGESGVVFNNLALGYYLVDSSLGTLCGLSTTNPDATIQEKNDEPTNTKTVEEDSTGEYGTKDDADIGQTVNFKSTINAKKGAANYTFHDKMSKGLTYTADSVKVTLDDTDVSASSYEVVTDGLTDECTFEVVFTQDFCDTLDDGSVIVISYSAVLNKDAVIAGTGNENESKLSYGDEGKSETTPSTTRTYTYAFDLVKVDSEKKLLDGAKFELYTEAAEEGKTRTPLSFTYDEATKTYTKVEAGTENAVTEIEVNGGKVNIKGLDADEKTTYYLHETAAPSGYNMLTEDVVIHLTATVDDNNNSSATLTYDKVEDSSVTATLDQEDTSKYADGGVSVVNQTGALLPSTGGIGTTIFYIVGGVLAAGAVILLITKRRMNIDNE